MIKSEEFYKQSQKQVFENLSSSKNGLSQAEANERLKKYGKNILPAAKQDTIFTIFFKQFINPIVFILLITVVLSLSISEFIDAIIIVIIILLNSILGTYQEWNAGRKALSLRNLIKVNTKVLRDDKEIEIRAEDLVLGDIVILEPGYKVSADLRIISSHNLTIDEAILTGESIPSVKNSRVITKDISLQERSNMAYAGSSIINGRGIGIVVAVTDKTEIGAIASKVLLTKDTKSPLVIRMENFTKQIAIYTVLLALLFAIILYFKGYMPEELFFAVVALSISAVPEGLSIALTLSLSIASSRMAKRNVIVKKLNAVESLGSCTIIASDKTGTLTVNEQTAKIILLPDESIFNITGVGYNDIGEVKDINNNNNIFELGKLGLLNNEAYLEKINNEWIKHGDSIDIAFLSFAYKLGITEDIKEQVISEIPYESENKYSAVFYKNNNDTYCSIKGSMEKILDFCETMKIGNSIVKIDKEKINKQNESLASQGYRIIAIANGKIEQNLKKERYEESDIPKLTLLGLIGFIDPIREDASLAIENCRNAGIKVVMITGDHPLTAFTIAKEINIANNYDEVVTGDEIDLYLKSGKIKFDRYIKNKKVFTRVTPMQKLEIVESYKRMGEFVAVTGDGVNDAPAMKAANIGVAIGSGTDVAKETGTMIITDDKFLSIVFGIEEGRIAYNNVRKVIYLLISCGMAEVLFFILAVLFNLPIPLVAVQLLWLNLVTNGIQDIALSFEKGEKDIMQERPRAPSEKIFNRKLIEETLLSAITIALIVFITWSYLINILNVDINLARGYILLLMVFIQNIHVFNCRSEKTSVFKIPIKNNPMIVYGIIVSLLLHVIISVTPISSFLQVSAVPLEHTFYVFLMALPILFVMEIYKFIKSKFVN